jgi:RHS repeat-associated protein
VRRDGPAGTTTYLVDPFGAGDLAQVLRESSNGEPVDYVYAADQLVSHRAGGQSAYHLLDGQRSTRRLTDEAGAITDTYDYDAFGRLLARTGTTPNDHLYNSQYLDSAAGLYYLRARHYDPALGRFLTTDPVPGDPATPATWHRYLYAGGDPVNREDPSGRFFLAGLEAAGRFLQSSLPALGQTLVRTAIRKAAQAGSKQITRTLLEPVAQRIAARIGQQTLRNTVKRELDDLIKAGSKNRRVRCFAAQIAIEIAPEFRKVQTVSSATVGSGLGGVTAAGAVSPGDRRRRQVAIVAKILDGPQLQLLLEVLEELKEKYCKDLPDPDLP